MKAKLLIVSCFLVLPLMAQDARVRRTPQPAPTQRVPVNQASAETVALGENTRVRLHGSTSTGNAIDITLAGIGPRFAASQVINGDEIIDCQYIVSETETGYKVIYTVGLRVKMVAGKSQNSTNYEYRDTSITGTVLCSDDSPQVLISNGGKPMELTITKASEEESDE